jgi:hypothetical protein
LSGSNIASPPNTSPLARNPVMVMLSQARPRLDVATGNSRSAWRKRIQNDRLRKEQAVKCPYFHLLSSRFREPCNTKGTQERPRLSRA